MNSSESTSWNLVLGAAAGSDRDRFASVYQSAIEAYLAQRWRNSPLESEVPDAVQEVFVEMFRSDGALGKLDRDRCSSFRAFLFGVVRNVARRCELRRQRRHQASLDDPDVLSSPGDSLSQHFDRTWAHNLLRIALQVLVADAEREGADAVRGVEVLRLRFQEGIPIREIARQQGCDPKVLHRLFDRQKRRFELVLRSLLEPRPGATVDEIDEEVDFLLSLLRPR